MLRGLELHEARKYRPALALFRRARRAWPACPEVTYNMANTTYLLGGYEESFHLLRGLARMSLNQLSDRCAMASPRALKADVYFLLFLVVVHWRGPTAQAFRFAEAHMARRARGLRSIWSMREVKRYIAQARTCRQSMRKITPIVLS